MTYSTGSHKRCWNDIRTSDNDVVWFQIQQVGSDKICRNSKCGRQETKRLSDGQSGPGPTRCGVTDQWQARPWKKWKSADTRAEKHFWKQRCGCVPRTTRGQLHTRLKDRKMPDCASGESLAPANGNNHQGSEELPAAHKHEEGDTTHATVVWLRVYDASQCGPRHGKITFEDA